MIWKNEKNEIPFDGLLNKSTEKIQVEIAIYQYYTSRVLKLIRKLTN